MRQVGSPMAAIPFMWVNLTFFLPPHSLVPPSLSLSTPLFFHFIHNLLFLSFDMDITLLHGLFLLEYFNLLIAFDIHILTSLLHPAVCSILLEYIHDFFDHFDEI